jgi:hypothetical protein
MLHVEYWKVLMKTLRLMAKPVLIEGEDAGEDEDKGEASGDESR